MKIFQCTHLAIVILNMAAIVRDAYWTRSGDGKKQRSMALTSQGASEKKPRVKKEIGMRNLV